MRQWFHSIGARIFAGFGLFIMALAVFFILTARTTRDQASLLEQSMIWDQAKGEVSKLLQRVEAMRAYALLAARLACQSPATCTSTPTSHLDRLPVGLCSQAGRPAHGSASIKTDTPRAAVPAPHWLHRRPSWMRLQGLVPPGTRKAELEVDFDRLWKVDELLDNPFEPGGRPDISGSTPWKRDLVQLRSAFYAMPPASRMLPSKRAARRLDTLVRWISLTVLLAGLGIAGGVTRAIRQPLLKVQGAPALPVSRGIDHPFSMPDRKDEIGEMARGVGPPGRRPCGARGSSAQPWAGGSSTCHLHPAVGRRRLGQNLAGHAR